MNKIKNIVVLGLTAFFAFAPFSSRATDGAVDSSFDSNIQHNNSLVLAPLLLPDGKMLATGGLITEIGIARLNSDGSLDSSFAAGFVPPSTVLSKVALADGKILIGGAFFETVGGERIYIARILPDGGIDASFAPPLMTASTSVAVAQMAVQPNGDIVVLGLFTAVGGQPRARIARLHAGGSLDPDFNPVIASVSGGLPTFQTVAVRSDGKIMIGGQFASVNSVARMNFVCLNQDGSVNDLKVDSDGPINAIVLQPDGKMVLGGNFTSVLGQPRTDVVRLNVDGSVDSTFTPALLPNMGTITTISLQINGKLIVGGSGGLVGGPAQISRLNSDGSLDATFSTGLTRFTGDNVNGLVQQLDGNILVGRSAGISNPTPDDFARPLFRLSNSASQTLSVQATRVQWLRSGNAPEVYEATFQLSTDLGVTWSTLGSGSRIPGGWELTGLSLPASGWMRVLSRTVMGQNFTAIGLPSYQRPFNLAAAQIEIQQPAGKLFTTGGTYDFGSVSLFGSSYLTFTVLNHGDADLTDFHFTIDGTDPSQFSVTTAPAASVAGPYGSTAFTVRFQPTSVGTKTAQLHLTSNSATDHAFTVTLTGKGAADGEPQPTYFATHGPGSFGTVALPDGSLISYGNFSSVEGRPRQNLARFNADGSVDPNFKPGPDGIVFACGAQPDGKILIGGLFTTVNGQPRTHLARLNNDGTLDTSFVPPLLDNHVFALGLQSDGKVVAGGTFTSVNGVAHGTAIRLNPDGSVDSTFADACQLTTVFTSAIQPDGKILLGGFGNGAASAPPLTRLNPDGTIDLDFHPTITMPIEAMIVRPDGKIYVSNTSVYRLNTDGSTDSTFNSAVSGINYLTLVEQTDGKLLVGGYAGLARLLPDGSRDLTFNATPDREVLGITLLADGHVALSGGFTTINEVAVSSLVRLHNSAAATTLQAPDTGHVRWMRSGSAPEVSWAQFDLSTDGGSTWTLLGAGGRIAGGWELSGLNLPATGIIRARSSVAGGYQNGGLSALEQRTPFENIGVNHPPTAPDQIFTRAANLDLKINIANLLAGCGDADNDALTLESVGASALGATITRTATHILYSLTASSDDSFSYTVGDGHGGFATGAIQVKVVKAGGFAQSVVPGPTGSITVNFAGIPGYQYDVERATAPSGPWATVDTRITPANGLFSYTDPHPPQPMAFYRLIQNAAP